MPAKKTKNSADAKKPASKKTAVATTPLKKGNVKPLRPTSQI